jgi:hypothetical protein
MISQSTGVLETQHPWNHSICTYTHLYQVKYDNQDQQAKTAFKEHTIQQQEPVARSHGGSQTKTGKLYMAFLYLSFSFSGCFLFMKHFFILKNNYYRAIL